MGFQEASFGIYLGHNIKWDILLGIIARKVVIHMNNGSPHFTVRPKQDGIESLKTLDSRLYKGHWVKSITVHLYDDILIQDENDNEEYTKVWRCKNFFDPHTVYHVVEGVKRTVIAEGCCAWMIGHIGTDRKQSIEPRVLEEASKWTRELIEQGRLKLDKVEFTLKVNCCS